MRRDNKRGSQFSRMGQMVMGGGNDQAKATISNYQPTQDLRVDLKKNITGGKTHSYS